LLIFQKGVDSDECSKGLGGYRFSVTSPCNFSFKNYTDIFYLFYEGNVRNFNLRWASTDPRLGFILIDLYVQVLTPRLYCSEAALQLSEDIAVIMVCCIYTLSPARELRGRLGFGRRHFCTNFI